MRILIIGVNGQLGSELQPTLTGVGEVMGVGRETVDFTSVETVVQVMENTKPDIVINAVAYTAVDKAESEPELAFEINSKTVGKLAQICRDRNAWLIHISTDYVFDGSQSYPYPETAPTHPLNVYGHSKLAGEEVILANCSNHIILRTAWVYGNGGKSNFVKTMLRLGAEREEIRVVADQIGSPTWTGDLAQAIAQLIPRLKPEIAGIYHFTNSGVASWYDFAIAIFEEAQQYQFPLKLKRVIPITTPEYPTPAKRPGYSVLDCSKIRQLLGTYSPHWRQGLRQMLNHQLSS